MRIGRRAVVAVCLVGLVVVGLGSLPTGAQEPAASSKTAPVTGRKKGEPTRRVPDYFGQIGLTHEQKASIYAMVDKHMLKVEALEKQIETEKAEMLAECETALDDTQKKLLAKLRAAAANPAPAPAPTPAKPAATPTPAKPAS